MHRIHIPRRFPFPRNFTPRSALFNDSSESRSLTHQRCIYVQSTQNRGTSTSVQTTRSPNLQHQLRSRAQLEMSSRTIDSSNLQETTLADRMKKYEEPFEFTLPTSPIILRLDGHCFSRFTKHFDRPFDQRIHEAMVATSSDLLKYFPTATVAYTQSDEITLVFPNGLQSSNGRIQKLASLASSYCSVRFGSHLRSFLTANPEPTVADSAFEEIAFAHFDARLYAVPSVEEALNVLLWRCKVDAVRNAVTAFARTMYTTEEIHKKQNKQLISMMETEKGIRFEESVPKWALQGCLLKREQFEHEGFNPKTGLKEPTMRTRTRADYRGVTEFNDENLRLVTDKYW